MRLLLWGLGLLLIVLVNDASATAQFGERLIYEDEKLFMHSTPLESYFSKENPKPRIFRPVSTACWRGYIGTWKIEDKQLSLVSLKEGDSEGKDIPLSAVFKGAKHPVKATWFSGTIRVPKGKMLRYVHMGFGSVYEMDLFFRIEKGRVVEETVIDNRRPELDYTSDPDLQWQELGRMTEGGGVKTLDPFAKPVQEEDQGWSDARLIRTPGFRGIMESGTTFFTRGLLFKKELYVPETPTTPAVHLPLETLPEGAGNFEAKDVEIQARFVKKNGRYGLHVDSIRALRPGESIHRKDFRLSSEGKKAPGE